MSVRKIETELSLSGEKQFNDQMKAVNSNLKTLRSEMALVADDYKGMANSTEALTEKQKILQEQYGQQKEKVEALEKMLKRSRELYGDNSSQVDRYHQQLNEAKIQLNKFSRELEDTNRYLSEAEKSADGAASSIDEFGRQVKGAESDLDGAEGSRGGIKGLVGTLGEMKGLLVGGAIAGGLKEIGEAVWDIAHAGAAYADEVLTMSSVTGISTDELQEYMYMADLVDVSVETITGSLTKLTRNMENARDGTGEQAEAFQRLGIEVVNSDGTLRDAQEVFYEVIQKLGEMTNETERDATSMEILGRSAQDLNPIIEAGSEKIDEFRQEAHDMDAVLSEETLGTLGDVQDAFDRLDQKAEASKNKLAIAFAPAIIKICEDLSIAWDKVTDAVIKAWDWMTKTEIKGPTYGYSNITGKYYDPDEEYYGMSNSYLDAIKNGKQHAGGLSYVPYDGYLALLHRGERVLTAGQAAVSRGGAASAPASSAGGTQVIELHTTVELDRRAVGESVTRYQMEQERAGR